MVDASWPNIKDPLHISAADHEAHTTHKSEFFITAPHKYGKPLFKVAKLTKRIKTPRRRKHS